MRGVRHIVFKMKQMKLFKMTTEFISENPEATTFSLKTLSGEEKID